MERGSMSITTILNVYKRQEYLMEQIKAVKAQTKPSDEIWIWQNYLEGEPSIPNDIPGVTVFHAGKNMKYHGRFALALLAKTKYVSILDDDTIPGRRWYENCLNTMKVVPGIMGGAGCILQSRFYWQHLRAGWPMPTKEAVEVDLVGHAWFFRRQDLTHMWREVPFSFENGEDIQFSYLAKKYGDVRSYCPPHPEDKPEMWSSLKAVEYGNDDKASSNGSLMPIPEFYQQRDKIICHAIDCGWKTVREIQ